MRRHELFGEVLEVKGYFQVLKTLNAINKQFYDKLIASEIDINNTNKIQIIDEKIFGENPEWNERDGFKKEKALYSAYKLISEVLYTEISTNSYDRIKEVYDTVKESSKGLEYNEQEQEVFKKLDIYIKIAEIEAKYLKQNMEPTLLVLNQEIVGIPGPYLIVKLHKVGEKVFADKYWNNNVDVKEIVGDNNIATLNDQQLQQLLEENLLKKLDKLRVDLEEYKKNKPGQYNYIFHQKQLKFLKKTRDTLQEELKKFEKLKLKFEQFKVLTIDKDITVAEFLEGLTKLKNQLAGIEHTAESNKLKQDIEKQIESTKRTVSIVAGAITFTTGAVLIGGLIGAAYLLDKSYQGVLPQVAKDISTSILDNTLEVLAIGAAVIIITTGIVAALTAISYSQGPVHNV